MIREDMLYTPNEGELNYMSESLAKVIKSSYKESDTAIYSLFLLGFYTVLMALLAITATSVEYALLVTGAFGLFALVYTWSIVKRARRFSGYLKAINDGTYKVWYGTYDTQGVVVSEDKVTVRPHIMGMPVPGRLMIVAYLSQSHQYAFEREVRPYESNRDY